MTTVSIMSDLHLEFADCELPGGDILILAGDIWTVRDMEPGHGSVDKRLRYVRFCQEELSKYARALFIGGNHESYGYTIDRQDTTLASFLAAHAPNARLLSNAFEQIGGVTFLGTPLWATCGVGNPVEEMAIGGGLNDFHLIRTTADLPGGAALKKVGNERRFTPRDANRLHQHAVAWLRDELPRHDNVVVIGHHAPSFLSAGGEHHDRRLDSAYCSNLHGLIEEHPQIKVWIHGHSHREERYRIGETAIVANPRGYFPQEPVSRTFDPRAADFDLEEIAR